MKTSEKLIARLKNDLGFEVVSIDRIRRGKWQKASGTWAWTAKTTAGIEIGSEDTMGECLSAKSLRKRQPPWGHKLCYEIDAEPSNTTNDRAGTGPVHE